jgi:hypothetical protein
MPYINAGFLFQHFNRFRGYHRSDSDTIYELVGDCKEGVSLYSWMQGKDVECHGLSTL